MNEECTISAPDTAEVPPFVCASWCEDGTGHPGAMFSDDKWCSSASARVTASLVAPWAMGDGSSEPATASVYASKDPDAAPFVVFVNTRDQEQNLTPGEARELAGLLVHFAWVAEQDGEKRNAFEVGAAIERLGMPEGKAAALGEAPTA